MSNLWKTNNPMDYLHHFTMLLSKLFTFCILHFLALSFLAETGVFTLVELHTINERTNDIYCKAKLASW